MTQESSALTAWLNDVNGPSWLWYIKYISANDTYAKPNVHQGGPYVAKELLRSAFPVFTQRAKVESKPDLILPARIDSHSYARDVRLVWYNSKSLTRRPNGRDEARLTQWGGRNAPLVEANATGTLVVFAFRVPRDGDAEEVRIWMCRSAEETDQLVAVVGDVEPGAGLLYSPTGRRHEPLDPTGGCRLQPTEMPSTWLEEFPTGYEIVRWVVEERRRFGSLDVDARLLRRRACEYDVFRAVEQLHVLPRVHEGFQTVDEFVELANSVTNRRKSRSGKSLELHTKHILDEEGIRYSWTPQTEEKRTPDFVFPSIEAYRQSEWPASKLRMLAAKTTCKDRWRQILNEAERIRPRKHLLTLQEGVSIDQHLEMKQEGVVLVVPSGNLSKFPDEIRGEILSLRGFLDEVRALT